jgi:hypothetical protein
VLMRLKREYLMGSLNRRRRLKYMRLLPGCLEGK